MDEKREIYNILLEDIIPNRFQPRLAFDEKELNSLANSIKQHGILQPLILRKIGDKFEIIAGERRYKAATLAGLTSVPAIVMNTDDNTSAELAIVENVQRKNLNAMEEAQSYKKLGAKGLTQDEIAKTIGVNQSTVANKIRLLSLDDEVQEALLNNKISERHARSLLSLTDPIQQIKTLNKIIVNKMTVKQTEEEIAKILNKKNEVKKEISQEIINLDNNVVSKMDLDSLLEPQLPKNDNKEDIKEEYNEELNTINPFQTSVSEIEDISKINSEATEILDFDDEELEPELENPTIQTQIEESNSNALIEEFRQQKIDNSDVVVDENNTDNDNISLSNAINKIRKLKEELNEDGFVIDTEEFDFEDMYQVVIKINKN